MKQGNDYGKIWNYWKGWVCIQKMVWKGCVSLHLDPIVLFSPSLPVFCLFSAVITLVFAVFVGQNVLMFIHREKKEKNRGQLLIGGMNHNFFIYRVNTISKWWMQGWCLQSCSAETERKLLTASFCQFYMLYIESRVQQGGYCVYCRMETMLR